MDLELQRKTALVTGSSSGIGAAIAMELAREGVSVVVHGRDREKAEKTAQDIADIGGKVAAVVIADLAIEAEANAAADQAEAALGHVDILVNNSGGLVRMDNPEWDGVSIADWTEAYAKNVTSSVRLIHRFVPGMKARGWGRIINTSSISGSFVNGSQLDYGAAKSALNNLTVGFAKLLGAYGITVNAIAPGTITTPAVERWLDTLREQNGWNDDLTDNERIYTTELLPQPIHRLGRPREIGVMACLLASPLSGYTTGAHIRVDGGMGFHV